MTTSRIQDRTPLGELSKDAQSVLRVFAERSARSIELNDLALVSKIPTTHIEAMFDNELRWWIDSSCIDEPELRGALSDLKPLKQPAHPTRKQRREEYQKQRQAKTGQSQDRKPYPWQSRALQSWEKAGRRGIIEAVTGTGKTHVGVMAIAAARASSKRIYPLVVVPTIPIMNQWIERLRESFPECRVGRIGTGHFDDFSEPGTVAVVAIVNSLVLNDAKKLKKLFAFAGSTTSKTMLVADECHHYMHGTVFSRLRRYPFDQTLGLSATVGDFEVPGIGKIVYKYGFDQAHAEGLVPAFNLINCSVDLTASELTSYLAIDKKCSDALKRVISFYGLNPHDAEFWKKLKRLMGTMGSGKEPLIEQLFVLFFQRAAVSYVARRKMELAEQLVVRLVKRQRKKLMVFFERIDSAVEVSRAVDLEAVKRIRQGVDGEGGVPSWTYHSQIPKSERGAVLERFQRSGPGVLYACRCLDEGIDLPDVDAAILVASTKSERQRIQRIGRVLRKGDGDKKPVIITLTVKGTGDQEVTAGDFSRFREVARVQTVDGATECLDAVMKLGRGGA